MHRLRANYLFGNNTTDIRATLQNNAYQPMFLAVYNIVNNLEIQRNIIIKDQQLTMTSRSTRSTSSTTSSTVSLDNTSGYVSTRSPTSTYSLSVTTKIAFTSKVLSYTDIGISSKPEDSLFSTISTTLVLGPGSFFSISTEPTASPTSADPTTSASDVLTTTSTEKRSYPTNTLLLSGSTRAVMKSSSVLTSTSLTSSTSPLTYYSTTSLASRSTDFSMEASTSSTYYGSSEKTYLLQNHLEEFRDSSLHIWFSLSIFFTFLFGITLIALIVTLSFKCTNRETRPTPGIYELKDINGDQDLDHSLSFNDVVNLLPSKHSSARKYYSSIPKSRNAE